MAYIGLEPPRSHGDIMVFLTIILDAQTADLEEITHLLKGGHILRACGIINTCWQDVSALQMTHLLGLSEVVWDYTADDTPGALELTVWYPHLAHTVVEQRLLLMRGIDEYDVASGVHD